jgi:arylsulfatase A-like enzyme
MGDNGFFLGEHGLEGKWFGYEESIRVPLFISYAGLPDKLKQSRPDQIALNIDVAPTILALAGVQAPQTMQGIDLIAMLEGHVPERKDFFYEHTYLKSPKLPQVEGVVTHDFKYMKYIEHNYEELYDVSHDPHETQNLATDKKYAGKLDELRARYSALKSSAR